MPWYFFTALLFFTPLSLKAFECRNFQNYACNNPSRPHLDGTNSFRTRTPEEISQVMQTNATGLLSNLPSEVLPLINDTNPDEFLPHHIWMSTNLNTTPPYTDCFTDEFKLKPNRNDCKQAISQALSSALKTQIFGTTDASIQITDRSRLRNEVLNHPSVIQLRQTLSTRIESASITSEMRSGLQQKFNLAQEAVIQKIQSLPVTSRVKQAMLIKLRSMSLNTNTCSDDVPAIFTPDAYYNNQTNSITFCPATLLKSNSDFFIYNILLHEIAHSLDACSLGLVPEGTTLNAFTPANNNQQQLITQFDSFSTTPELTQCLRSNTSVNARVCGIDSYDFNFTSGMRALVGSRRGATPDRLGVCNLADAQDQSKESISDWFSAELMPTLVQQAHPNLSSEQWRAGIANSVEIFCKTPEQYRGITASAQNDGLACDAHPADNLRIDGLILANPQIRTRLSCSTPSSNNYCAYGSSNSSQSSGNTGAGNNSNGNNQGNSNSSPAGTGQ